MEKAVGVVGWRKVVLHFTPQWYLVNMGTGLVAIVLHDCPYQFHGLRTISTIVFIFNIALFIPISIASALRYVLFPYTIKLMLRHPTESIFVGTLPMAMATIIYMFTQVAVIDHHQEWGVNVAWSLWWIDVFFAVLSCFGMPIIMIKHHEHKLDKMLATWILPIVPVVVNPSVGAIVASTLPVEHAIPTIFVSYFLWGIGISLCFLILSIYLQRLLIHNIPDAQVIASAFLPAGPLGLGAFGFVHLSVVGRTKLVDFISPTYADTIYFGSVLVGFLLWSFGTWWLFMGLVFVMIRFKEMRFNLTWWGFVFPIGAYTTGTLILAVETQLRFFKIWATITICILVVLWLIVLSYTLTGVFSCSLFIAPSLTPSVIRPPSEPEHMVELQSEEMNQVEVEEQPEQIEA